MRRVLAVLAAAALAAAACTATPADSAGVAGVDQLGANAGGDDIASVIDRLCPHLPVPPAPTQPNEGSLPPAIAAVASDVARLRGLDFLQPVAPRATSDADLTAGLDVAFDWMYPAERTAKRSLAWRTIGVLDAGVDIREEMSKFAGNVLGYYDTITGELVYIGTDDPSPAARATLAHELVHAIEDQHFGLERLDAMTSVCDEEALMAAVGVVEGSANHFMHEYIAEVLTPAEQDRYWNGGGGGGVSALPAPFVMDTQLWPYSAGERFVDALVARGGIDAVDAALRDLPVSTEQVMHPERYPDDVPTDVAVPDLGPSLGDGWRDLDAQIVGEAWLLSMLGLRPEMLGRAHRASEGWDGGAYRAWTDGTDAAVVLVTAWDTATDAGEFAHALRLWCDGRADTTIVFDPDGLTVTALFVSDPADLARLLEDPDAGSGPSGSLD